MVVTRLGKHRPGELGVGYPQANGYINFFPDRGGFAVVKVEELQKVEPNTVDRRPQATVLPVSVLQAMSSPPKRRVVRKVERKPVRKVRRVVRK